MLMVRRHYDGLAYLLMHVAFLIYRWGSNDYCCGVGGRIAVIPDGDLSKVTQ